jgi:rhodanese-related sulfurtransferase
VAFPTIGREELWQKIQDGDDFVLVDALSPITFAMAHLPGAINMTRQLLDDRARRRIPDHDTEVVVYCSDENCDSSTTVANRLLELGYTNVRHYAGGRRDWEAAGLPLEGGRVTPKT